MTAFVPALPAEPAPTPESQLLLPFFEVSLEGFERVTFFSIANSSSEPIELTATVYTNWAIKIHEVRIVLEPKQVRPVNLHDWIINGNLDNGDSVCLGGAKDCLDLLHIQKALAGQPSPMTDLYYGSELEEGVATGFVTFTADQGFLPESDVLWGDYFYTDPIENFAQGERLVRLEADLACADLCFRHSVRFLEGGVFTGGTKLTVWSWDGVPNQPSKTPEPSFLLDQAQLDVYNQDGDLVAVIPKNVLPAQTIEVGSDDDLKLSQPFGWFDLTTFQVSAVSGLYRAANRFSVGVPAWCLPCDPCNENGACYDPTNRECKCFPAHVNLSGDGSGTVGKPFSMTYNLTGSSPMNVRVRDLPAGLSQNGRTIEGVPRETGTFTISVDNLCGNDEIAVTIGPDLGITYEGSLTLIKEVKGGGPYDADDFNLFFKEQGVRQDVATGVAWTFTFSSIDDSVTVRAGEDNREGYTAGSWTGDCGADGTVTIKAEENKTCKITNTYNPARLTLIKHVRNDDGGTAEVEDFVLFAGDTRMTSGVAKKFPAGTYRASEVNLPGYEPLGGWTGDCAADGTVTLDWGDNKVCEIWNDDTTEPPAKIKLIKHVKNDDGGTATVSDFPLYLNGQRLTSGVVYEVSAGAYVASEQNLDGYVASSWSGDCAPNGAVNLAPGDNKVCEITNDDQPAMITLVKYVSGGTAQVSDFPLYVGSTRVTSSVAKKMAPGSYKASEQTHSGYTASTWSGDCAADGSVTLALGDNKRCEITNTYTETPTLKLIKHVVNDNGGTAQVSDFALFVSGTQVTSGVAQEFAPGSYQVSEQNLPGYEASSWSGDCAADGSVSLDFGDHKVCEITNNDKPATIKLIKHVDNTGGGTASVGDFNLYVSGTQVTSGVAQEVAPGSYTASEDNLDDYDAGSWSGDCAANGSVTLALGEHKVCHITNTYSPTCDPDPTFSIWSASVDYNDPHRDYHHTEVRFSYRVGGEVDGEVQLFWRNGGSTYIKKRISIHRDCDDAATEGNLFWESNHKSHHPGHGAEYFARLVIGGQVVESISLN